MHHYARAHMIKIWQYLLYLLNCWSFSYQTWLIEHYHKPECFLEKLDCCVQGEGHSKISKCLWMFCPDGIFLHAELFTTILGVVMHHYARAHMIKLWQFVLYLLNCWSFCYKLGLIVHYHKPECFMEKLDCCVQGQGHSKISKCQWMFV